MSLEKRARQRVIRELRPLHAVAVENVLSAGTPDVCYVHGWLELKCIPTWPRREGTVVTVPHFTDKQRAWLHTHVRCGGRADVLLKVGPEWLLLRGDVAAEHLGRVTRPILIGLCDKYWARHLPGGELLAWLSRPNRT